MSNEFDFRDFDYMLFNQDKFSNFCAGLNGNNILQISSENKLNLETELALINAGGSINDFLKGLKRNPSWDIGIKGLKILEIGCGSENTYRNRYTFGWPPLFCRITAHKNAERVVGVDINNTIFGDREKFHFIKGDVVPSVMDGQLTSMVGYEEKTVDVVRIHQFALDDNAPNLKNSLEKSGVRLEDFERKLVGEAKKLLKDGGVLLTTNSVFKLAGSKFDTIKGSGHLPE